MISKSYDIFLVTTNVRFITEAIAKILNIKSYICSELEIEKGIFSGRVKMTLAGNKNIVSGILKKYGKTGSIAVGDSENDIDMLRVVDLPVVFEPDKKLKEIADAHGWVIIDRNNAHGTIMGLI
jgi:phosphoserine phosphatase